MNTISQLASLSLIGLVSICVSPPEKIVSPTPDIESCSHDRYPFIERAHWKDSELQIIQMTSEIPEILQLKATHPTIVLLPLPHTMPAKYPLVHRFDTETWPDDWRGKVYWGQESENGIRPICRLIIK